MARLNDRHDMTIAVYVDEKQQTISSTLYKHGLISFYQVVIIQF